MEWWQWIVFGIFVLGAEAVVDSEFYLIFIGLSAIVVGFQDFAPFHLPPSGQWLMFSALAVSSIVLFRQRVYESIRGDTPDIDEGVEGESAIAQEEIRPGSYGQVELRGAYWSARNTADQSIPANGRARVERSEGLTLLVRPEPEPVS